VSTGSVYLPPISPQSSYSQPNNLNTLTAATIIGSKDTSLDPLAPDSSVYLISIDDRAIGNGWRSWNSPALVEPGEHLIEFGECTCSLLSNGPFGLVNVEVNLVAGQTYTLKATQPVSGNIVGSEGGDSAFAKAIFGSAQADGWIADKNGTLVSRVFDNNGDLVFKKYHFLLQPHITHGLMVPE
jgi:hypothetical protein